jgi:hypothetical protein
MIRTVIVTILAGIILALVELIGLRWVWDELMVPVFKMPELTTGQFLTFVIFIRVLVGSFFKTNIKTNNIKEDK